MSQIVNESTSVIQIDSSRLQNGQASVVYVSSTTIPDQFVTILDATGYVSSPQSILISTVGRAVFSDGSSILSIKQRYGYLSLVSQDQNTWSPVNINSFPDPLAAAIYRALDAPSITTSSLLASSLVSTTTANTIGLTVQSTAQFAAQVFASTLFVNALPQYLGTPMPKPYRAYVADSVMAYDSTITIGAVSILGSISTGKDVYVAGNISSKLGTIYVGGNVTTNGSIRGQRGTLISVNTLQCSANGSFNGNVFTNSDVTSGNLVRTNRISTGAALTGVGLAAASSIQLGSSSNAIKYMAGYLNFVNTPITVPSISTNNIQASNALTTSNLIFQSFGPASTLRTFTMISTQIENASGSATMSSIDGGVLTVGRVQATQVATLGDVPCATITMNDSGPTGTTTLTYPPFSSTVLGTISFPTYWTISSVGAARGTLFGGQASLSTTIAATGRLIVPQLRSVNNEFFNVYLSTLSVSDSIFFSSATLLSAQGVNINNVGGGIIGANSEIAEFMKVSSIRTDLISTIDTMYFNGHSTFAMSAANVSSLTSRTILTSSLGLSRAVLGNPVDYSTINSAAAWLLPSTFRMGTTPFTTTTGLGTYFNQVVFSAAADQTAYYSIINPVAKTPTYLSSPYVNTLVGTGVGGFSGDGGAASNAAVGTIIGQPAADANYNLYIGDNYKAWRLRKIDTNSNITTIAGNNQYYYGDGLYPLAAALGPRLSILPYKGIGFLISDNSGARIRYVDTTPIITTIAGNGNVGYSGDGGLALAASLWNPGMMATDSASNIFIADGGNNRIRKISGGSTISLYAGTGVRGATGDGGPALSATFNGPYGMAINSSGLLYLTDTSNCVIRSINPSTGIINVVAGNYTPGFSGDGGDGVFAQLAYPTGLTVDPFNDIYICDTGNRRVRRLTPSGPNTISTIAGNGSNAYSGDGGPAYLAALSSPTGVTTDSAGNLYIADTGNHCIRFVDITTGRIRTVAGQPTRGGNSGDYSFATFALLSNPGQVAYDPGSGYCYIADNGNNRIRYLDTNTNIINAYAGNGSPFSAGDGVQATTAVFGSIHSITADTQTNIYIADGAANIIRKIDHENGNIYRVVGTGVAGFSGDGDALTATLSTPTTIISDSNGDVYICDTNNHRVRKYIVASGSIETIAGTGVAGYNGDSIPAMTADLNYPRALTLDGVGNIFIGDSSNYRVRQVNLQTGLITTALGNGTPGAVSTTQAIAGSPIGVITALTADAQNNLYFADATTSALWGISSATFQAQSRIGPGYLGDAGPLSNAIFRAPTGYFCDTSGNFVVCDNGNARVRRTYTYGPPQAPTYLNLNLTFTNYFTSTGVTTISLNGSTLQRFTAATQSTTTYSLQDFNVYAYPLQGSNPALNDQTPYLQITQTSTTGYTKLAGNIWINTEPGQQALQNLVDSNAGLIMNRGTLRFPFSNGGITIQNPYNDASMRTVSYTGSLINPSDPALKEQIEPANLGMCYQTLADIPLRTYTYIQPYTSTFHVHDAPRLGFLTREVEPFFPRSITTIPFEQAWAPSSIQTLDLAQIKFAHLGATQYLMQRISSMETAVGELAALKESLLRRMATQRNAIH